MIEAIPTPIPQAKLNDISLWLHHDSATDYINALKAEVASLTADAVKSALDPHPHRMLSATLDFPATTEANLRKAAVIQLCINTLEAHRLEAKLNSVTLKIV